MLTKSIFILLCLNSLKNVNCHKGLGDMHQLNNFPGNRAQAVITRENICNFTSNTFAGLNGMHDHPPDAEFVCEVCTDSATFRACAGNASRCFPRIDVENRPKLPSAFCTCINGDLELNASYTAYVSNGGMDCCNDVQMRVGPFGMMPGGHGDNMHPSGHEGGMHPGGHDGGMRPGGPGSFMSTGHPPSHISANLTDFMQTLNQSNPTLLAKLECCMSQKTMLFDSSGSANVTAWHKKADLKPDGTASTAIKTAIDQCATDTTIGCNVHSFMHCIMQNCFSIIQNSSG